MYATCTCTKHRSECIGRIFVKIDAIRVGNLLEHHSSTYKFSLPAYFVYHITSLCRLCSHQKRLSAV